MVPKPPQSPPQQLFVRASDPPEHFGNPVTTLGQATKVSPTAGQFSPSTLKHFESSPLKSSRSQGVMVFDEQTLAEFMIMALRISAVS